MLSVTDFYRRYPMMAPYKGSRFGESGSPSLLLVGESHYFPRGSDCHRDPTAWYGSDSTSLSETERTWISTAEILREQLRNRFRDNAHVIWKRAFHEINANGPQYGNYCDVAQHVATYNFFLRPADEGVSIAPHCSDVAIANAALQDHCIRLRPTAIVILSSLVSRHVAEPPTCEIPMTWTPHPGCRWWNTPAKRYKGKRGREVLAEFIRGIWARAS